MSTSDMVLSSDHQLERKYLRYLAHDMNNNLGAICLLLEDIKNRLITRPQCGADVEALQAAQQTISRTAEAMRELLQREQQAGNGHGPVTELVDLYNLMRDVAGQFTVQAKHKGAKLMLVVPAHAAVESNGHLIGLILQNLIDNAVKYSDGGIVRVTAEERGEPAERQWLLSVSDEGPGIPQEHLLKLFSTCERESTHGPQGFGIGLAIASDAAKQLGAQLRVTSCVGFGSIFFLLLPSHGPG